MENLIFKSYEDLVNDIKKNISKISHYNFDLVVGIPRSGMIPAYLISAYLNIDCSDINDLINNAELQRGITRKTKGSLLTTHKANRILLVDDSIFSGDSLEISLNKIPNELKCKITTLAVYSSTKNSSKVDIYFEYLNGKKLFEWGIYHNNLISETCVDIDGVICEDPTEDENDDGEKYINFIENGRPLFIPSGKIHALVSNRLEKYRKVTEDWLKKHNVQYSNLILLDLPDKISRTKIDAAVIHKGFYYKKSTASFFIESCYNQSLSIAKVSGKPVYCVEKNIYIKPELVNALLYNTNGYFRMQWYKVKHIIKMKFIKWNVIK